MPVSDVPLSFAEAFSVVAEKARALGAAGAVETLALLDAQGRVLARPVVADRDQPPFPRSTRDGFAARARDWARGSLEVSGLLRAGEIWHAPVPAGACVEIMTGAPVPADTDCVVMVEHVIRTKYGVAGFAREPERPNVSGEDALAPSPARAAGVGGGELVTLAPGRPISAGENVVGRGAEARAGAELLAAGTRLNPHGIAVAAACGHAAVAVYARPRVAILATGDELVEVGQTPLAHQIRNSNSYTLAALVRALGGDPLLRETVADDGQALEAAIGDAAAGCDLLLLSGGVSMGKYDLVEPALAALGGDFYFTGARIQPGKPVVFGSMGPPIFSTGPPFFGLPGNPVSVIVCFALFVAPLLAALGGERGYRPPFAEARLGAPVTGSRALTRFLPARLLGDVSGAVVEQIAWQGSGDLPSTARANCFLVIPEGSPDLAAGATVTVLLA